MNFEIFADGSSLGNPGPAGAGVAVYKDKALVKKISLPLGEATNNTAEYAALLIALSEAAFLGKEAKGEKIRIYMDSSLVVNQLQGKFKVRNESLKAFFAVAKHMRGLLPNCEIFFRRRAENQVADKLAKSAAQSVKSGIASQLELLK